MSPFSEECSRSLQDASLAKVFAAANQRRAASGSPLKSDHRFTDYSLMAAADKAATVERQS